MGDRRVSMDVNTLYLYFSELRKQGLGDYRLRFVELPSLKAEEIDHNNKVITVYICKKQTTIMLTENSLNKDTK